MATPIPFSARVEDSLAWKYLAKGDFDLKSAYLLATDFMRRGGGMLLSKGSGFGS